MADFLVELRLKLSFWSGLTRVEDLLETKSFWLPAFFHPDAFLRVFVQQRARAAGLPFDALASHYEVQSFYEAEEACPDEHALYFHGLWLEGADWSSAKSRLQDAAAFTRFVAFPVVKLATTLRPEFVPPPLAPASARPTDSNSSAEREFISSSIPSSLQHSVRAHRPPAHTFSCPLYASTLRLSARPAGWPAAAAPIVHINLPSTESATKWIKMGVALVLERSVQ